MALPVGGDQPRPESLGEIKARICRSVGGEQHEEYLTAARDGVQSAIDDINMRAEFDFLRRISSVVSFVEGQQAYDLPDDFYRLEQVRLLDATDSDSPVGLLDMRRPAQLDRLEKRRSTDKGQPAYAWIESAFNDESLNVWPIPNATSASDLSMEIRYMLRIQQPVEDADIIAAPRELMDLLLTYGQYYVKRSLHPEQVSVWNHLYGLYRDKLNALKGAQKDTAPDAWALQVQWARGKRTLGGYRGG